MKKYHKIVAASMIFAIMGMFVTLYQIQSEDAATNEYPVYEMNHNWRFVSVTSVMEKLDEEEMKKPGGNPAIPSSGKNPDGMAGPHGVMEEGNPNPGKEDANAVRNEEEVGTIVSLPYEGVSKSGEMIVFQNTITQEYAGLTLVFYSIESTVRVSLNDKVIYQYGVENQRMFGKSPGSRVNLVDLPEQIGDGYLRIELISSYENAAATLGKVTVSARDIAILQLIESNLVKLLSCVIMLISSVVFLLV